MNPENKETYLGDGVYAVFDGYDITLDLRGQDSTTFISLSSYELDKLNAFAESCGWDMR